MLNKVTMMGRLCADPELKHTQSNVAVTSFRIAVERNYTSQGGERETDFFDVTAWRGTAEIICDYFSKGRMIAIDGRLETRNWKDRDGNNRVSVCIVAENIYFADSKRTEEDEDDGRKSNRRPAAKGRKSSRSARDDGYEDEYEGNGDYEEEDSFDGEEEYEEPPRRTKSTGRKSGSRRAA